MAGNELDTDGVDQKNAKLEEAAVSAEEILLEIMSSAKFIKSPEKVAYAVIPVDGHREVWRVDSEGFIEWLQYGYFQKTKRSPPELALNKVIAQAKAQARFAGREHEVGLRTMSTGDLKAGTGAIYLDMCDDGWRQIEITADGWQIISDSPVMMRRSGGMAALPEPAAAEAGNVEALRCILNISTENDFRLIVSWLISVILPGCGQPILIINGPQGAAKSVTAETTAQIADPNIQHTAGMPRNIDDFHVSADLKRAIVMDNISRLSDEMSDEICRAATGTVFNKRTHFSNRGQELFFTRSPMVMAGILDFVGRPDLGERSLFVRLDRIPPEKRRTESAIKRELEEIHPVVLAGLLNAVSEGLKNLPHLKLTSLERMADFYEFVSACEPALPWESGGFAEAYTESRLRARQQLMDGSETFAALLGFMESRHEWTGTASELLKQLLVFHGSDPMRGDDNFGWPKSGKGMSGMLGRYVTELAEEGIRMSKHRAGGGSDGMRARLITLTRTPPTRPSPRDQNSAGITVPNVPSSLNGDDRAGFRDEGTVGTNISTYLGNPEVEESPAGASPEEASDASETWDRDDWLEGDGGF